MKVAIITGISGQDGAYLARLLLSKGYKVVGVVRDLNRHLAGLEYLGISGEVVLEGHVDIGAGAKINCSDSSCTSTIAGASSGQSVNVVAFDRFEAIAIAGGVAAGFVGVAGGVNVGSANATVQAFLGGGTVRAVNLSSWRSVPS